MGNIRYEKETGQKADRLLIISPMVRPEAAKTARELGIEVYNEPEDIEEV